jgi:hypothetical protein
MNRLKGCHFGFGLTFNPRTWYDWVHLVGESARIIQGNFLIFTFYLSWDFFPKDETK